MTTSLRGRRRIIIAIATVALLAAGCRTVSGTAAAGEPSVDAFEGKTGDYSIVPPEVDDPGTEAQGIVLESLRLGDVAISPADADPTLDDNWSKTAGPILSAAEATGEGGAGHYYFAGVTRPIFEQYGMLGGYSVSGADIPLKPDGSTPDGATAVTLTIIRFPSEDDAAKAAAEIDAADFEAGGPENEAVEIPGYPDAHSHWRPDFPSLAATTAHGPFVVDVFAFRPAPDKNSLTALVRKVYDAQFPKLDAFTPTPTDEIADLPVDPDGLFARTLSSSGEIVVDGRSAWVYDLNGLSHIAGKEDVERLRKPFTDAGVTRIATAGEADIVKTRDGDAAKKLLTDLLATDGRTEIDTPTEIAEYAVCYERTAPDSENRYGCYVRYRDYVAGVTSGDKADLADKARAQFAVLANAQLR